MNLILLGLSSLLASESTDMQEDKPDIKLTALYRHIQLSHINFHHAFYLLEAQYIADDYTLDAGFSIEDLFKTTPQINNLSISFWQDDFSLKMGKYITKVGVMDYLESFDRLNPRRAAFYNDPNPNIRKYPQWMIESSLYLPEERKITFYLQKYDTDPHAYLQLGNYLLFHDFIPALFGSDSQNDTINFIAQEVFQPSYENSVLPITDSYIEESYGLLPDTLKNSTFGMDFLLYSDQFNLGAIWINTYSKIPQLKPSDELIELIENTEIENREETLREYIDEHNIGNLLRHFRYNKAGFYAEGSLGELGIRSEISYQDKYAFIDRISPSYSIAIGADHKGWMYNSLEFKRSYFRDLHASLYQGVVFSQFEPFSLYGMHLNLQHEYFYLKLAGQDYSFSKPSVKISYKNLDLTLEYLHISDNPYIKNSVIWLIRTQF